MTTPHESGRRVPAGVGFAIASALLFGLSTPFAKLLLGEIAPLLLAGLLYAGSGVGLAVIRLLPPVSADEAPSPVLTCPGWRARSWPAASSGRCCSWLGFAPHRPRPPRSC